MRYPTLVNLDVSACGEYTYPIQDASSIFVTDALPRRTLRDNDELPSQNRSTANQCFLVDVFM